MPKKKKSSSNELKTLLFDLIDISWAAGFYEGEGNIRMRTSNSNFGDKYKTLHLSIAQVNVEPLRRFQSIFDIGCINGPYVYCKKRQPYCVYTCASFSACLIIMKALYPYLSRKKRAQLLKAVRNVVWQKRKLANCSPLVEEQYKNFKEIMHED